MVIFLLLVYNDSCFKNSICVTLHVSKGDVLINKTNYSTNICDLKSRCVSY